MKTASRTIPMPVIKAPNAKPVVKDAGCGLALKYQNAPDKPMKGALSIPTSHIVDGSLSGGVLLRSTPRIRPATALMIRDAAKRVAEMPDALSRSTRSPIRVEHLAAV
jgi:hypothetical protein